MRFALLFILFFIFSAQLYGRDLNIEYPDNITRGQPFIITIKSAFISDLLKISWQGNKYIIPSECSQKGCDNVFMLAAVYETGGDYILNVDAYNNSVLLAEYSKTIDVLDKNYPKQHLTVDPAYVNLTAEVLERIKKESEEIFALKNTFTLHRFWKYPLNRPVSGEISAVFGVLRVFNNEPRSRHSGTDFKASKGTPVKTVAPGTVIFTGEHYFAGKCVYVDHGLGVISIYMHLSEFNTLKGDFLKDGTVLGYVGSTGRSTGPHLHLSLSVQGVMADPEFMLK